MLPKWIMTNSSDKPQKQLTIIIHLLGGDVHVLFAFNRCNEIQSSISSKTVGLGLIASCGFLIFIAGKKGQRILTS